LTQAQLKGGRQSLPDFECHVHREPWGLIGRFTQTAANCVTEAMPRAGIVTRTGLAKLRRLELDKANFSMGLAAQPPEPSHSPVATREEAKKQAPPRHCAPGAIVEQAYFVLKVLEAIQLAHAFFLSRYRHGVSLYDPSTGQPLDLPKLLRPGQCLDQQVLLGGQKVPVHLVAHPVLQPVATERRRQACANRDRRLNPSAQHLYLLGWNIFVTNVPRCVWPAKVLQPIYRLRWRIEIIFKARKSHLGLRQLNCRTAPLLSLSVLTKLLFCIIVFKLCNALELLGDHQHEHVSLLRLASILGHCTCWFAATLLGLTPDQWVEASLQKHLFYELRKDRKTSGNC